MKSRPIYPLEFYKAQRANPPNLHRSLRSIRCAFCTDFRVIPRSQWLTNRGKNCLHIPDSTDLFLKVSSIFPSFSLSNSDIPTSICPSHLRRLRASVKNGSLKAENSTTDKKCWTRSEILEIDLRFSQLTRATRSQASSSNSFCQEAALCAICYCPSGIPSHKYNGPLEATPVTKCETRNASKKKKHSGRPLGSKKKKEIQVIDRKSIQEKRKTLRSYARVERIEHVEVAPATRRKRTVIVKGSNSAQNKLTLDDLAEIQRDANLTARQTARIAEGFRRRAKDSKRNLTSVSGAAHRAKETLLNKAFEGDFVAHKFPIASDGYAYLVRDPEDHFCKVVYFSHKTVRTQFLCFRVAICS